MKCAYLSMTMTGAAAICGAADPVDLATIAAMRLSEASNYSWTATVQDDARAYVKEGKHLQSGFTWVTLPMLEAIERRLGRDASTDLETIFRGSDACVIRLGERWQTVKQLPRAPRWGEDPVIIMPQRRMITPDMPADAALEPDPFPPVIVLTPVKEREDSRPFSNARLAPSPPHEELAIIVSSWTDVVAEEGEVKGRLTDVGARLLLCPGGEAEAKPLVAAGEFTLWLKGGWVSRYQVNLEGLMAVGRKQIIVRQSADTRVHDVGRTKFDVPAEARIQLGQ